jgi:hypothetical protein
MNNPALSKSRRKSWQEIYAYYVSAVEHAGLTKWSALRDFSRAVADRPHLQSLVTVGSLGSVFVFRNADCKEESGYILIAASPTQENAEIKIGFFSDANYDPAKLAAFRDIASALDHFERCLTEHDFTGANA